MLIHDKLFYELGMRGFPAEIEGHKIKYWPNDYEADLEGFEDETERKIKVMGELWETLTKSKNNSVKNL